MQYQKDSVVYSEHDIRSAIPNVSLPEILLPEHVSEFGFSEYTPSEPIPLTPEEIAAKLQLDIITLTQHRLDDFARTRGYDGILSLCTYVTSPSLRFSAEGQYGVEVRDATWSKLYEILGEIQNGIRPMPSGYYEIEPELPILQWPV